MLSLCYAKNFLWISNVKLINSKNNNSDYDMIQFKDDIKLIWVYQRSWISNDWIKKKHIKGCDYGSTFSLWCLWFKVVWHLGNSMLQFKVGISKWRYSKWFNHYVYGLIIVLVVILNKIKFLMDQLTIYHQMIWLVFDVFAAQSCMNSSVRLMLAMI